MNRDDPQVIEALELMSSSIRRMQASTRANALKVLGLTEPPQDSILTLELEHWARRRGVELRKCGLPYCDNPPYIPKRKDQRFCCAKHKSEFNNKYRR